MSRYAAMFDRLARQDEAAFGAFLMLGDPDIATSASLLDAVVDGGADMIEVGIPFSDPIADGPVIQAAAGRALLDLEDLLDLVERQPRGAHVRDQHQPLELTPIEEPVAAVGAADGPQNALFLVKTNRAQRVVGAPGHLAGGQERAVVHRLGVYAVFVCLIHGNTPRMLGIS